MTVDLPPVRHHRRSGPPPTRPGRLVWRAGQVVAIAATLAVGALFMSVTPGVDAQQKPFVRTAAVGRPVDARTFDVTVLGVRGAALLADIDGDRDTSGVWILVHVRLTARRDPSTVGYAALIDGHGRTYRATARIDQPVVDGGRELQPGVPITAELAFEVPVSVAPDVSLQLAGNQLDQRMDAMAQVPLPITAAEVSQWRAEKTPVTVAPIAES